MSKPDGLTVDAAPCLNCGSTVQGKYCCHCGQRAHVHRTLSALGHELAHGVLHIDGKIWNTLPLLLRKPGDLTRRYIAGERAKFLSPMGLYLFSVFLLFAVMAFVPNSDLVNLDPKSSAEKSEPSDVDSLAKEAAAEIEKGNVKSGETLSWLEIRVIKSLENSKLMGYKIKSNGYKMAWVLIPLSLPFMWLVLIGRRGYYLFDHAVFVTYSISFMGLLASIAAIIGAIPNMGWFEAAMMLLIPPVHMYKHLKYTYALGRIEAAARLILLLLSVLFVLILYFSLLVVLGVL